MFMVIFSGMKRTFYLILISIILFIGINTVFYFTIFRQQLDFQTDLLARQTRLCGIAIEEEGLLFESELNSIPYQDDFTRLFTDEEIKKRGSTNLQKLYTEFSQLINKITVYDNNKNVYSLILDLKNNFVSDYYESQRQTPLNARDELIESEEKYMLSIPGFDEDGVVRSNILVDLNFTRFVNSIFRRYGLEHALWQCLVSEDGEMISTARNNLVIQDKDLKYIASEIIEESEGTFMHTIVVDSISTHVVSAYYPVRLVKRNLGIVFSIKAGLFLRSIIIKIILITLLSLILLALILYLHHHVIKTRLQQFRSGEHSEESLKKTMEILPFGLLFLNPDGSVRLMNQAARKMLAGNNEDEKAPFIMPDLQESAISEVNEPFYKNAFGPGSLVMLRSGASLKQLYRMEWNAVIGDLETRIILLIDVSEFEISGNLEKIAQLARTELLESMSQEISVPLRQLREILGEPGKGKTGDLQTASVENLQKSLSLLSSLISATMEFARQEAGKVVVEEIPFYLSAEIDLALEPFRGNHNQISIITKIRNDVPERLVGDPFRLRQALRHLVENALELTSEGRILISAELLEKQSGFLRLQFQVEDTGRGLPPERIREIMHEISTGEDRSSGEQDTLKLRLAVAQQHIQLMRGNLWMESPSSISTSPDKPGIRYIFSIEAAPAESTKDDLVFKEIKRPEEINCLVITQEKEQENEQLRSLTDLGLKLKFLVYRPENTGSLCELVAGKLPSLHLLIIINSSTQNGFPVAEEMISRGLAEKQVLILLSSVHKFDNYTLCRNAGVDYYIGVPYEPYRFVEILTKHFPGLSPDDLRKIPEPEKIDPNLRILLAEDNIFNRKLMQGLFKRLGLEIDFAENGRQAVDMAREKSYDFIFMDLLMPEKDGLQAVAEMRKAGLTMPVIAFTAVENRETRKAAMDAGFNEYLVKPASEESLRKILIPNHSKSD
jgi:CheY-like chemotaxis protein/signal transduction histidine kinase